MAVVRNYELTYADTTTGCELCFDVDFTVNEDDGVEIQSIELGGVDVTASFAKQTGIEDRILESYKNGDWDY